MGTLLAPYWWVGRPITFSRNCCWLRESVSWFDLNDRDLAFPFLLVASSLPHILLLSRGVKVHQKELGQRTAFASLFWPFFVPKRKETSFSPHSPTASHVGDVGSPTLNASVPAHRTNHTGYTVALHAATLAFPRLRGSIIAL